LDRLSQVTRASLLGLQNQTGYAYPNLETSTVSADENTYNDGAIQSTTVTDLFGRTVQTQRITPQLPHGTIYTQTDLDALGRASIVHSPNYGVVGANLATYTYDAAGRATNVLYPDGSQEIFAWTGDVVTHTDPAGAKTQQQVDSQGRIVQVIEDPSGPNSATTNYTYDALNDLTGVTRVSQTRSFTYNSLKELISATNPETAAAVSCNGSSVSVCYTYDADGNLATKTAAAGTSSVQTSYAYDSLDRMTTKSYSDGVTPNVTYCYDGTAWSGSFGVCNGSATAPAIGRLTQVGSSASNTSTSYL
jgi:YD repeat-containing protein